MEHEPNHNFYMNGQADNFYEDAGFLIENEARIMRSLLEHLPNIATANILDAGCGAGVHLQNLRKLTTGAVYGIDVSEEMLTKAKEESAKQDHKSTHVNFERVDLIEQDICKALKVPEGFFNVAISTWVLCHACNEGELRKMIANVGRTIKSGGKFYAITVNPMVTPKDFDKLASKYSFTFLLPDKTKNGLSSGDEYVFAVFDRKTKEFVLKVPSYYYGKETLEKVLREEGFEVNRIVAIGDITGVPQEFIDKDRVDGAIIEATKL